MKRLLLALLRPPQIIVVLAPFAIVVMMVWVFVLEGKQYPASNVAYVLSFYLLVVFCVWVVVDSPVKRLRCIVCRNRLIDKALNDKRIRQNVAIQTGIAVDILWAFVNAFMSIAEASMWFATFACFYMLFGVTRLLIYSQMRHGERSESKVVCADRGDYRVAKAVGIVIVVSTIVLAGMVTLVLCGESVVNYSEIAAISLAAFTFYTLASAIVACLRTRYGSSLIEMANARISLSIALVALFTLEVALLTTFGEADDGGLSFALQAITGACIACVLCVLGMATILQANQNRKISSPSDIAI